VCVFIYSLAMRYFFEWAFFFVFVFLESASISRVCLEKKTHFYFLDVLKSARFLSVTFVLKRDIDLSSGTFYFQYET